MHRPASLCRYRPAAATLLLTLLTGCGGSTTTPPVTAPTPAPTPAPTAAANPFTNVVFIGDSLSAGFQNGSLLDTQQPHGFASLIAQQANFPITLPLIAPPGYPAVYQLISAGFPPNIQQEPGTTTGRDNPTIQPSDLAVPGHLLHDLINTAPLATPLTGQEAITSLVLGFPVGNTNTQLQEAIALKPSTLFVWIGSDDALGALGSGMPSTMTSLAAFTADYTQLITTLKAQSTANLVVANIPDVTLIPYLTPASEIISLVSTQTGLPTAEVGTLLGLVSGDLVNAAGLQAIEADLSANQIAAPLTDAEFLTPSEIATIETNIDSYNQVIAQQVSAAGGTLVDIHSYFPTLTAGVTIDGYTATSTYLGGLFGLDGIHPTNTGYALLANQFLLALNSRFSLSLPPVNVSQVAANDPYFGANIQPTGQLLHIPVKLALQADQLITGRRGKAK
jgi:phospholipase/lecithinase/hemolysin